MDEREQQRPLLPGQRAEPDGGNAWPPDLPEPRDSLPRDLAAARLALPTRQWHIGGVPPPLLASTVLAHDHLDTLGARFSCGGARLVTFGHSEQVFVHDADTGEPLGRFNSPDWRVADAQWGRDDTCLLTYTAGAAHLWRTRDWQLLRRFAPLRGVILRAQLSPDDRQVLTLQDAAVEVWDSHTGESQFRLISAATAGPFVMAAFSPDGSLIVTGAGDGLAQLWDAHTGKPRHALHHLGPVLDGCFAPDSRTLLTVTADGVARLWDVEQAQLRHAMAADIHVEGARFSPDGTRVVAFGRESVGAVWCAKTGKLLHLLDQHTAPLTEASFSPDGARVLTLSHDGLPRIFEAVSGALIGMLPDETGQPIHAAFSPDGRRVATVGRATPPRLWRLDHLRPGSPLVHHTTPIRQGRFSPDGALILTCGHERLAHVWDRDTGAHRASLDAATWVAGGGFHPETTHVLVCSMTGSTQRWRTTDWESEDGPRLPGIGDVYAVADPNLTLLATATEIRDAGVRIHTLSDDAQPPVRVEVPGRVSSMTFSPDGSLLLATSDAPSACLWDPRTGRPVHDLTGHADGVTDGCFSPDGSLVVTVDATNVMRLWRTHGTLLGTYHDPTLSLQRCRVVPDHAHILTTSPDGDLAVWHRDAPQPRRRHHLGPGATLLDADANDVLFAFGRGFVILSWDELLRGETR